jgi:ubiquitin carboxyl-terminal hydrolase L5
LTARQAFFTAILGLLGVKGARIEEVLSVDEDTLATLPYVIQSATPLTRTSRLTLCSPPVHGLVFLYEYVAEESVEATETSRDVWFANQVRPT